jgi:peptidoglycan glycosyltransferase
MNQKKKRRLPKTFLKYITLLVSVVTLFIFWRWGYEEKVTQKIQKDEIERVEKIKQSRQTIAQELGPWFQHNNYPESAEVTFNGIKDHYQFEYTFASDLQKEADRLLRSHKPDYGAIVVMNAVTGQVLALSSYQKGVPSTTNLNLKSTFPAASIFKIVTASAALDRHNLSPDTIIMFNGANHTLYKKNVMYSNVNRWTREMSLREAFARSVNTFFGRLTMEKLTPKDIEDYAIKFGFNTTIKSDLPFDLSFTEIPNEKNFHLAEMVSGYNRVTTMSPIHGAMIAASVADGGVMRVPYVIQKIRNSQNQIVFDSEPTTAAITLSGQGAEKLKELMEATIYSGTSKKSFRPLVRDRRFRELELGGKTGSLTGTQPKGKVDWFVGYGIGGENDKLAVATITVNVNYWTVKSSHLAQAMLKAHFKDQFSDKNKKFFNANAEDR